MANSNEGWLKNKNTITNGDKRECRETILCISSSLTCGKECHSRIEHYSHNRRCGLAQNKLHDAKYIVS
uniref:Uncharacterized protein n=1 Tax=Arion vulgaris TaxID=1028688 RepID=A0A0B7AP03_9EUPU